ncbi:hypothetical protein JTB14_028936 [Gonioctena quinquepunctata]|nr:hypothetical protein JTB14_028936 [Gonioctena quinquepunctata]
MMDEPANNYIKRERQRLQERRRTIDQMRKDLPVYTLDEIRELKLPYVEALLMGLEEKGYVSTASYLKELFHYQEQMRQQAGVGTNVWFRPQLIHSKKNLQYLSNGLRSSEDSHRNENYAQECGEFLKQAVHFAFDTMDWWWLGEQLLIQSIKVSTEYTSLGGKYEALSRFAYAKFLIENVKEYEDAYEQLNIARELAVGKVWTSKAFFSDVSGTLFMQINHQLFDCLYRKAEYVKRRDIHQALSLAILARKRAAEACHHEGETQALMLKGNCELQTHNTKAGINSFARALRLQQKLKSHEGICKARIELAKAYLAERNYQLALRTLILLKEEAEKYDLPFYLGQAYKNLGEHYLASGEPERANPLLKQAMQLFQKCGVESSDVDLVRNFEAISAGLEVFLEYAKMLINAGRHDSEGFQNLMKMVAWKDDRTPFWDVEALVMQQKSLSEILTYTEVTQTRAEFLSDKHPFREEHSVDKNKIKIVSSDDSEALIELHDNKELFESESAGYLEDILQLRSDSSI